MSRRALNLAALLAPLTSACASSGAPPIPDGLPPTPWGDAPFPSVVAPAENPMTDAKIELGNDLFYDPILSGDQSVACVTCHSERWGLSDGLPVSVGVGGVGAIGPGRDGPNKTTRNALALWNAAFRPALFWDGRASTLEEQARKPLEQPKEMNLAPDAAAARLAAVPAYAALFETAFPGEGATVENMAKALASFERTIVASRAPYDRYVEGDLGAMSDAEKLGMNLFAKSGCTTCHAAPLFESNTYVARLDSVDEGRFATTKDPADKGAFRVPTLRNSRESAPYFHDGSTAALEDAVRAELEREVALHHATTLDAEELADLTAFIADALMDRTRNPARPRAVPSGLEIPPDGSRVSR